jgi:hypothetical protein
VNSVIRALQQEAFWLDPQEVKVISPTDPIAKDVRDLYRRYPGPMPIRFGGTSLGGMPVEGAYIYPPPVSAPTT